MNDAPVFRPPRQERSRRTLERILRATRELLAEQGADATSVQQIVDRAGSSVGSFYARFDGRDDLLDYLERRVWDEARERWDRALEEREWDRLGLSELATGVVRLLLDVGRHEAGVRRALQVRRGAGADGALPIRRFQAHVRRGIRELLLSHAGEMVHPDPHRAVELGLHVVVGGLRELDAAGGWPDDELVGEVSRLFLGYLGSEAAEGGEGEPAPIDFFDVWA